MSTLSEFLYPNYSSLDNPDAPLEKKKQTIAKPVSMNPPGKIEIILSKANILIKCERTDLALCLLEDALDYGDERIETLYNNLLQSGE